MWGTKFFLSHCIGDWPLAYTRACRPYRHSTWYTWVCVSRLLSLTFLLLYFWHGDRPQLFISCLRLPPTMCFSDVLSIWLHLYWSVQRLMQSVFSVRSTCMNRLTPVHAIVDHQTDWFQCQQFSELRTLVYVWSNFTSSAWFHRQLHTMYASLQFISVSHSCRQCTLCRAFADNGLASEFTPHSFFMISCMLPHRG